jgi:GNAT superfamily N-acetyltransferase
MSWAIREATVEDIPNLVTLGRAMFEAMGYEDSETLDRMCEASGRCFERHVRPGRFAPGLPRRTNARSRASVSSFTTSAPSPGRPLGKEACSMDLVTLPSYRRRGIASTRLARGRGCEAEGVPLASLHATQVGRGIYERDGFEIDESLPEMRLPLT